MNTTPQPFVEWKGAQDTSSTGQITGQVPPRSAQRATAAWLPPECGKKGDRNTWSCRTAWDPLLAVFFWSAPNFLGTCPATSRGNLSPSVAPVTPLGPATNTHWQSNGHTFSTHRTGQDQNKDKRQKQRDIEYYKDQKIDERQDIDEHAQHCSLHKHVWYLVECCIFFCKSLRIVCCCVVQSTAWSNSFVNVTVPSHA